MVKKQGATTIREKIGKILLRLVGLFHIGFGPYWFIQEVGFLGRIGRWDIAIAMVLLTVIGFVLLLRPSYWAGILAILVYASWEFYQCLTMGFMWALRDSGLIVGIIMAFIFFCSILSYDSSQSSSNKSDNGLCDHEQ